MTLRLRSSLLWRPFLFIASALLALPVSAAELVAYYPFNGSTEDASGQDNHAGVVGAIPTVDRFGNPDAAYLVGPAAHLEAPDSDSLDLSEPFALAAWFRMDDVSYDLGFLVGKDTNTGYTFSVYYGGSYVCQDPAAVRQIQVSVAGCSNRFANGPSFACGTGEWRHVVVVYEPMGPTNTSLSLYVDGNFEQSLIMGCVAEANTTPLGIGKDGFSSRWFTGAIDDVRVYNSGLTAGEVSELYDSLFIDGFESGSFSSWMSVVP